MEETIDLGYLFKLLKRNLIFIIVLGVVCGVGAFCISNFALTKKYQSNAMLYVENKQQTSETVNINDINAAQKLVNTCQIIFKSDTIMQMLRENLQLSYTFEELDKMITAQSVNSTEVMRLTVESTDPKEAEVIVNELVRLANDEFLRIIESGSIKVVDYGKVETKPVFPNNLIFTVVGFAIGILIAFITVYIRDMLDVAIKQEDNIAQTYNIPVFAQITDFEIANGSGKYSYSKHGYGYGYDNGYSYGEQERKKAQSGNISAIPAHILTQDTPFSITEAYNTARTNIMFAAAPEKKKIISVTSSNPSEGKSTTCANIAISFANAGLDVLLVECDLRKPTMSKRFKLTGTLGLSSILGGFCNISDAVHSNVSEKLDVITAGDIPPNPSELLSSEAMKTFLDTSAAVYDYIFLDTPPVNFVTDSQLMNDEIAGLVFVIREGVTTHPDLQAALERIKLANGKALGFIKTFCKPEKSGRYGRKYGKYSYKYGYKYGKSYGYSYKNKKEEPTGSGLAEELGSNLRKQKEKAKSDERAENNDFFDDNEVKLQFEIDDILNERDSKKDKH